MLSQREPRDAAVILQRYSAVSLPQHGLLLYISGHSNAEIRPTHSTLIFTAVTQNQGDARKSRHSTKITVKATVIVNT